MRRFLVGVLLGALAIAGPSVMASPLGSGLHHNDVCIDPGHFSIVIDGVQDGIWWAHSTSKQTQAGTNNTKRWKATKYYKVDGTWWYSHTHYSSWKNC